METWIEKQILTRGAAVRQAKYGFDTDTDGHIVIYPALTPFNPGYRIPSADYYYEYRHRLYDRVDQVRMAALNRSMFAYLLLCAIWLFGPDLPVFRMPMGPYPFFVLLIEPVRNLWLRKKIRAIMPGLEPASRLRFSSQVQEAARNRPVTTLLWWLILSFGTLALACTFARSDYFFAPGSSLPSNILLLFWIVGIDLLAFYSLTLALRTVYQSRSIN